MKTAKEIIKSEFESADGNEEIIAIYERAVNSARRETIEECAKIAKVTQDNLPDDSPTYYYVDKQSILSLIDELK
jgi:hypothetical protein